MEDDSISALGRSVEQPLRSAEGLVFVAPGVSAPSPGDLQELRLTLGPRSFHFRCAADGETLAVDGDELRPVDLGEHGELCRVDLSQDPIFGGLAGVSLRRVSLLKAWGGRVFIGVVLEFEARPVVICNWGDELRVWESVPGPLFASEGIQIVSD